MKTLPPALTMTQAYHALRTLILENASSELCRKAEDIELTRKTRRII